MAERLLSQESIESIETDLNDMKSSVEDYRQKINTVIQSFNGSDIIQSFYSVGNFGKEQQDEIIAIKQGLDEFYNLINKNGGLVMQTQKYLEKARALNQTGKM